MWLPTATIEPIVTPTIKPVLSDSFADPSRLTVVTDEEAREKSVPKAPFVKPALKSAEVSADVPEVAVAEP